MMHWLDSLRRGGQGSGYRHTALKWDQEYREGRWEQLGTLLELAHLAVLAGYLRRLTPAGARVLDVGCGAGWLLPLIAGHFEHYLGIDVPTAVALAKERHAAHDPHIRFQAEDMNEFTPEGSFDAIVFCESLYYLDRNPEVLRRYLDALAPAGVLLVSCHARHKHAYVWRRLDQHCETMDAVQVRNVRGTTWNVRALSPRRSQA